MTDTIPKQGGTAGKSGGMVKTTSLILAVVILSKLLGMVREMLLASRMGAGIEASAYSVSFSLVFMLTLLFSCFLQTAFLPIYSRARAREGKDGADRYTSGMLTFFGLAGLIVGILFYVFAPAIVSVYSSGYDAETQHLIVQMTRTLIPMFVVQVIAYLLTALLNANEDFVLPHIATMALSFALIPTLLAAGSGTPLEVARMVTIATSASALIEVLIQLPTAAKRMRFRPILQPTDPLLKQTLLLAVPAVIATGTAEFNQLLQKNLTSYLDDGANAALAYGYKTYAIYVGLFILPITVILFSRLSAKAAQDDRPGMLHTLRRYLETLFLILIPVILVSMLMHRDIVRILYQRGAFSAEDTLLTASALLFFLPGLLGYAAKDMFSRFFFTLQDTRTPMLVGLGSLGVNVALNLLLIGRMGIAGLALASSTSLILSGLVLALLLRLRIGKMNMGAMVGQSLRMLLAAGVCGAASILASRLLDGQAILLRLLGGIVLPLGVYAGMALLLRVTSARYLTGEIVQMLRKGKKGHDQ